MTIELAALLYCEHGNWVSSIATVNIADDYLLYITYFTCISSIILWYHCCCRTSYRIFSFVKFHLQHTTLKRGDSLRPSHTTDYRVRTQLYNLLSQPGEGWQNLTKAGEACRWFRHGVDLSDSESSRVELQRCPFPDLCPRNCVIFCSLFHVCTFLWCDNF